MKGSVTVLFEICTPEGRGVEKGGNAPFIPEDFLPVYMSGNCSLGMGELKLASRMSVGKVNPVTAYLLSFVMVGLCSSPRPSARGDGGAHFIFQSSTKEERVGGIEGRLYDEHNFNAEFISSS